MLLSPHLPNTKITSLDIGNNRIGIEGMKALSPHLPNTKITSLDISNNRIGIEGMKALSPHLANTKLTSLDIAGNHIGDGGMKVLSPHLANTQLTSLNINNNGIGAEGIIALSPHLANTQLTSLDISNNWIGIEGIKVLSPHLANTQLTSLIVKGNFIGVEGMKELFFHLPNTQITSLDITNNRIGVEGIRKLSLHLANTQLTSLHISYNEIGVEGMKALSPHLANTQLTSLIIRGHYIGDEWVKALSEFLVNGGPLTIIGEKCKAMVSKMLENIASCSPEERVFILEHVPAIFFIAQKQGVHPSITKYGCLVILSHALNHNKDKECVPDSTIPSITLDTYCINTISMEIKHNNYPALECLKQIVTCPEYFSYVIQAFQEEHSLLYYATSTMVLLDLFYIYSNQLKQLKDKSCIEMAQWFENYSKTDKGKSLLDSISSGEIFDPSAVAELRVGVFKYCGAWEDGMALSLNSVSEEGVIKALVPF